MNPKQTIPAVAGMNLGDIYYILFRHKVLIAVVSLLAVGIAVAVYCLVPVPYQSEARLMIKYVHENKPPEQIGEALGSGDVRGEGVVNSEIEILTSMDLATNVVNALGAGRILGKNGETNATMAAAMVRRGLLPPINTKSDVIELVYSFNDPEMVQPILSQIIDAYLKKHQAVHHPEFVDFLQKQIDDINFRREETGKQLHDLKQQAGITSLDDSKKSYTEMSDKLRAQIFDAQAQLAGYQQTIRAMEHFSPGLAPATNASAVPSSDAAAAVPPDKIADYQRKSALVNSLETQQDDLLTRFTTNNLLVKAKQSALASAQAQKAELEAKYPALLIIRRPAAAAASANGPAPVDPKVALNEEIIKAEALTAQFRVLTNQLATLDANNTTVNNFEGQISQLQRDKEIQDTEFAFYSRRLEESKVNDAVGPGNSNISQVEAPTPPSRDLSKLQKVATEIVVGGLFLALGLPFLIELYFDRSLKRPQEVQAKLNVPFFLNIPLMNFSKSRPLKNAKKPALLKAPAMSKEIDPNAPPSLPVPAAAEEKKDLEVWDEDHSLRPFHETLRDRLVTYFEMINLTHKPKLVAVTSCGEGAGVTSTAAGLASALSETGDGNVLLVDMNGRDGDAHHFYKGKLAFDLDQVLEKGNREGAYVQENLYVATEFTPGDKLPRILPKRFSHLLPKLKASDFDYIIFDMPPVSQISITPRLARFMDMVLLVVESEKTDSTAAKQATQLLVDSKTNVGVVLNKSRSYVPRRLQFDI